MQKHNQFNDQQQHSQADSSQTRNPPKDKELSPSLLQGWHHRWHNGFGGSEYLSNLVEQRGHLLIPLLGYSLLLLAFFDYVYIVYPPQFTNPLWELQTIGALVEHVVAPLLGLFFVFYRHEGPINTWERKILGLLSWVSLLLGLLYLLMLPLGIIDTWRIYQYNNIQVSAQLSQQSQQLQPIKQKLNQAKTDEQIEKLLASLTPQTSPKIKSPQTSKDQLLTQISQAERNIKVQADNVRDSQRQTLLKNSVKWNLGALVVGTLFIWIWHFTDWTRISHQ